MQFPQAVVNCTLFCFFVLFCFVCRKVNVDSESEKVTQVSAYSPMMEPDPEPETCLIICFIADTLGIRGNFQMPFYRSPLTYREWTARFPNSHCDLDSCETEMFFLTKYTLSVICHKVFTAKQTVPFLVKSVQ